ncbi:dihydrolipoamide acetyltransferase family protein [Geobacter sp. DSM 9736]|uniref:dihydrolipoamide acetyltransferase family protein n=1 Tax=Geobacter sp. DSM 9736 TaxID=1277350 RepID=UPI000B50A51E|nr:dihydrolipoamide acetyltransferase family protein [Geobacter sp. DSM 9736]SNB47943.1 pyruvate dehydrogenase E2 component (dihydrolipoamide acetyltransferase) [Geobacter sp. DSM 9736]
MATEITMPKLSDTMTEGRLISWKKSVGDRLERGDILAEVETDKATMELESFSAGVLLETRAKAGDMVAVGAVIGVVGEAGEKVAAVPGAVQPEAAEAKEPAISLPKEEPPKPEPKEPPSPVKEETSAAGVEPLDSAEEHEGAEKADVGQREPEPQGRDAERASPIVRRLARESGVDLREVRGSGPGGRILREDLDRVLGERQREKPEVTTPKPSAGPTPGSTLPLTRMRSAIARLVTEAWHTIPHFAVTVRIDMGEAEVLIRGLRESGKRLSVNDLVIKGCAAALVRHPGVNATFGEESIVVHPEVNIGIAVSLPDGLMVPVIKGCQDLSLLDIAERSREAVARAREGKGTESDFTGGTFSISNLGMYGVEEFMAIIHPPQGAILAIGAIDDEAGVREGQIVAQRVMRATLSADHRLIDGAYAAKFMGELKKVLENPVVLLV